MGQTLPHGVYLPDEGERNCYAGLAANWSLLDGAVGTVAEHTSQIAGKAPAVHTHTKSDVTDLLNSNFIPAANNTYDLGSSSYQWSNLYAKNYYYNGTAWGLDKANVYSLEQTISATSGKSWNVKNTNYTLGENTPSSDKLVGAFAVQDNDNNNAFLFNLNHYSNGEIISRWLTRFKFTNGVKSTTGTQKAAVIEMGLTNSGDRFARPGTNGDMDLGTSSYKWKSLNGINPGALSLPDFSAEFDVSGQIVPPTGENQISINWGKNTFTPSINGWLSIRIHKATAIKIYRESRASYCFDSRIATADDICVCSPVVAGVEYTIKIQATQFSSGYDHFRLSPCQGNV